MTRSLPIALLVGATLLAAAPVANAASYPKLSDIKGESAAPYLQYELKDVLITSYQTTGSGDDMHAPGGTGKTMAAAVLAP